MSAAQAPSVDPAEQFLHRRTPVQRIHGVLHATRRSARSSSSSCRAIVFGILNPRFFEPANLSLIFQQVAVVGALAVGQTIIILTAGIDLSVGAIMVFTSIVMAASASKLGLPGPRPSGSGSSSGRSPAASTASW